jgi:signal transduction histidine kinase/HPt (histidine-containing phosphotransfer) domain-containing protein/ActR/RegA family two-component response regulator
MPLAQLKLFLQQRWPNTPHIVAWLVVILVIIALWRDVNVLVEQDRATTLNNAVQNMSTLTIAAREHALRTFRSADQTLRFVKARYAEQGTALDLRKMMARGVIDVDIFNQVGIIDANGIYALSNLPLTKKLDLSDREHFKVHLGTDTDELFISKALFGRVSKKWSIQMTRRINGGDGSFGGVAVVSVDPYYFTHFFGELNLGLHGEVAMFCLDGEVLARRSGDTEEFAIKLESSKMLASIARGEDSGTFTKVSSIDGIERIFFYQRIQPYRIGIVTGLATKEVLLDHRRVRAGLLFQASLATLLMLALGCVFSWYQRRIWQELNARMLVKQELAALNLQLTLQAQRADAANLAKSSFLANMSHELRTPMNAVIGIGYLLEKSNLPGDANELVRKIGVAGHALLAIINDVLDLSTIEAGRIEIAQLPFRLGDVLDDLYSIMSFQAQQKQIALHINAPHTANDCLSGDAVRLKQVLLNLVGNAIKFTECGHVQVDITVLAESEQRITLRFSVLDTGIGIEPDRQDAVFESFSQEDSSITRRFGGTGLGLTISRDLVALMGGAIGIISIPGSGSEFWFALDFERCVPSSETLSGSKGLASAQLHSRLRGVRMMVVDDSDINRDMALRIFEGEGAKVILAEDGHCALQWLQHHAGEIDVVLMDLQMPVMDGYQATRLIHATPELADLPVIALTANVFSTQKEAARNAGMTGFLSKPFDVDAAIGLIQSLIMSRAPVYGAAPASNSSLMPAPSSALVVIDVARGAQLWSDLEGYRTYLHRFVDSYGNAVGQMQANLASGDRVATMALAHKLAGVAGNLALPRVAAGAERVLATAGDLTAALEELDAVLLQAVAAIEQFAPLLQGTDDLMLSVLSASTDRTTLAALLFDLMAALDGDDPGPAEPVLAALARHIPKRRLDAIVNCVRDYDFRGAEAGVLTLANELDLILEK